MALTICFNHRLCANAYQDALLTGRRLPFSYVDRTFGVTLTTKHVHLPLRWVIEECAKDYLGKLGALVQSECWLKFDVGKWYLLIYYSSVLTTHYLAWNSGPKPQHSHRHISMARVSRSRDMGSFKFVADLPFLLWNNINTAILVLPVFVVGELWELWGRAGPVSLCEVVDFPAAERMGSETELSFQYSCHSDYYWITQMHKSHWH